jgi:hypothetical protein
MLLYSSQTFGTDPMQDIKVGNHIKKTSKKNKEEEKKK